MGACMRLCRLSVQHSAIFLSVRNIVSLLVCKLFNQEMDTLIYKDDDHLNFCGQSIIKASHDVCREHTN